MSQTDSYNFKIRAIQQQWKMHNRTYRTLNNVFKRYCEIQNTRAQSLKQLLVQLDGIQIIFYRDFITKLGNYLDTNIYQSNHLVQDIKQMINNYANQFQQIQKNIIQYNKQLRRRKFQCMDSLIQLNKNIGKNYPKNYVENYNYCLLKYQQANNNILQFRKTYHPNLIKTTNDQIMRFFVFQLQKLRNNQFDIDQIIKKSKFQQQGRLVDVAEEIQWKKITGSNLITKYSTSYQFDYIYQIAKNLLQQKINQDNQLFLLLNPTTMDENISKIPVYLQVQQFQLSLRKLFVNFRQQDNKIILNLKSFKKIEQISKIVLQYSIQNLKAQLLQALIIFLNGIKRQKIICRQKDMIINQLVSLYDQIKNHDYLKQQYWIGLQQFFNKSLQGQQKQQKLERCRKCIRKLGISILDQLKPKKKIFSKINNQQQNEQVK